MAGRANFIAPIRPHIDRTQAVHKNQYLVYQGIKTELTMH